MNSGGIEESDVLIVHQNIRCIRKNFDVVVANIDVYKRRPSFIFLSEIWIGNNELHSYDLSGYTLFGACNDTYRSGGVCVYFDSSLCCSLSAYNLSSADVVKVEWSLGKDIYVILCIYRLHGTPVVVFLQEIYDVLRIIKAKNLFVIGDINIDILNWPSSCDDYMLLMASFGLESIINVPTRVTTSSSTCIDHFFARLRSNDLSCLLASTIDLKITDHHFIEIRFKFPHVPPANISSKHGYIKKLNFVLVTEKLEKFNWNLVLNLVDPSLAIDHFLNNLSIIFEQCYTYVKFKSIKRLKP